MIGGQGGVANGTRTFVLREEERREGGKRRMAQDGSLADLFKSPCDWLSGGSRD